MCFDRAVREWMVALVLAVAAAGCCPVVLDRDPAALPIDAGSSDRDADDHDGAQTDVVSRETRGDAAPGAPIDAGSDAIAQAGPQHDLGGSLVDGGGLDAHPPDAGAAPELPPWDPVLDPRAIAPLSTTVATSRRPTFRWSLGSRSDRVRLTVCADARCSVEALQLDVEGTSARPAGELGTGAHGWFVEGIRDGHVVTSRSPVWVVTIPPVGSDVDTSRGATADFDGDGRADVVVGAPGAHYFVPRVYVYRGRAEGIGPRPDISLDVGDMPYGAAGSTLDVADVNADGLADLIVGVPGADESHGRVLVYAGSPSGPSITPTNELRGPTAERLALGAEVRNAGDVNGDGFGDVVVAAPGTARTGTPPGIGRMLVFAGSSAGLSDVVLSEARGPAETFGFARHVAGVGDFDGDGYADVAASVAVAEPDRFGAWIYRGGAEAAERWATWTFEVRGSASPTLASAGDADGDGRGDIAVRGSDVESAAVSVFLGPSDPGVDPHRVVVPAPALGHWDLGAALGWADLDRDGLADLLIGAPASSAATTGRVYVTRGAIDGPETSPWITYEWMDAFRTDDAFGRAVAPAGDVDGDGFDDFVVGAPASNSGVGCVYLFRGSSVGPSAEPWATLVGVDYSGAFFGTAVR